MNKKELQVEENMKWKAQGHPSQENIYSRIQDEQAKEKIFVRSFQRDSKKKVFFCFFNTRKISDTEASSGSIDVAKAEIHLENWKTKNRQESDTHENQSDFIVLSYVTS